MLNVNFDFITGDFQRIIYSLFLFLSAVCVVLDARSTILTKFIRVATVKWTQRQETGKAKRKATWTFIQSNLLSLSFSRFYHFHLLSSIHLSTTIASPRPLASSTHFSLSLVFAYEEKWKCLRERGTCPRKQTRGRKKKDKIRWKWENILLNLVYKRAASLWNKKKEKPKIQFFSFSLLSPLYFLPQLSSLLHSLDNFKKLFRENYKNFG